jgi:flotillin
MARPVPSQKRTMVTEAVAASALGIGVICATRYKIANANQYVVRTGLGIKDIAINKKCILWPFQQYKFINMNPENYQFALSALSVEKIPFELPGVFTIGPKDDIDSLIKYVRLLSDVNIHDMILGILEGATRILASKMTLEDMFNNRDSFKKTIIKGVQEELDQFGLFIYNANIKEMKDGDSSKYFHNMMQKKESETANMAKVDVAEANKRGNIGEKEREASTRQQIAIYEAETIKKENYNKQEIINSNAEVAVTQAKANQLSSIANIESDANSSIREYELMQLVQQKKTDAEIASYKASVLAPKMIEADVIRLIADATLYSKQQEAAAVQLLYQAQSDGLNKLSSSFGGNNSALMQFLMMENKQYEILAHANADAFKGLSPKITMFNTGPSSADTNPISDIFKMLPMGFMYLNDQLGLTKLNEKPQVETALVSNKTDE